MMLVPKGQTDVTSYFHLRLTADGTDATGLTVTNFDLQYVRSGATPAAKVDASALGAANSAHADNSAIEVDATDQPGVYRVDWPDAAFATGVDEVLLTVKCATAFTETLRVRLLSVTRGLSGTALPDAAADAAGGLIISDAGGLDADAQLVTKINDILTDTGTTLQAEIDGVQADTEDIQTRLPAALTADGNIKADTLRIGGTLQTANDVGADVNDILVDTAEIGAAGAGLTNINLPNQTMDITGNITGNLSGSVGSVTGNVGGNVTGSVGSLAAQAKADVNAEVDGAIETYHLDHLLATAYDPASKPGAADALLNELVEDDGGVSRFTANALEESPTGGSAPTVGEIADAVWDEAQADHVGAGSFGVVASEIADILEDTGTTLQAELDGIQADTEDIQTRLPAALVNGRMDASVDGTGLEAAALAAINAEVDTALADYDGPTRAEATADKDEILTDVGTVDTVVDAIKAKTDSLTFTEAGQVDANVQMVNDVPLTGDGNATPWGPA
jgi:hypothetical protein